MRFLTPLAQARVFVLGFAFILGCDGSGEAVSCVSSRECESGQRCVAGTCTDRPDGAPVCEPSCNCLIDDDCSTGFGCVESRCVDGECFHRTDDALCAAGETCSAESGCVTGTPIVDSGAGDADAGDADASDGASPTDTSVGGAAVGDPCIEDTDCMSVVGLPALCVTGASGFGGEFLGGYCSAICDPGDPASCGPDAGCVDRFGSPLCLSICETVADCREAEGYGCRRDFTGGSETRSCRP